MTLLSKLKLVTLSFATMLLSSSAFANSCSKSDIEYYLERGFTNAQVVQLCAGPTQNSSQQTQTYQNVAQTTQYSPQQSQLREDASYLSAALDTATDVDMNNDRLSFLARECIEYGPQNNIDLIETICVNTKLKLGFSGMKVGAAKKGLFLVRDATVNVSGDISRELVGLNELRRQDREAIKETLSTKPRSVDIKIRRGIDPSAVAQRLKKYAK